MVLYKTLYTAAASSEKMAVWGASQTDASKARAQLKRDGFKVIGTQTKEVPTTKGPLLEWLNENVKA
jgi:hypothetical protein